METTDSTASFRKTAVPLMDHWYRFSVWALDRTEKFPKSARFTLVSRIDNLLLDGICHIIEARYDSDRLAALSKFNIDLEKLRFLLRLAHERKYLSSANYFAASENVEETGRMVGGWIKCSDESKGRSLEEI